jgi:hypothetical protein
MNEFYTVTLDKEEKLLRTVGYVIGTLAFAVVITLASGIL